MNKNVVMERAVRSVPTAVGLPIKVKVHSVITASVDGLARMIVEPNLFRADRNRQIPDAVKIELNAEPK